MTSIKREIAARKRAELDRGSVSGRLSPAIDARRRLNRQRRSAAANSASQVRSHDPRFDYLTHSHD